MEIKTWTAAFLAKKLKINFFLPQDGQIKMRVKLILYSFVYIFYDFGIWNSCVVSYKGYATRSAKACNFSPQIISY